MLLMARVFRDATLRLHSQRCHRDSCVLAQVPTPIMRSMSGITRDEVAHLASLARLKLTDDELDHYSEQLAAILDSVASVSEVAADDVPATSHPVPMINVFRDDVVVPGLTREQVLSGAPASEDNKFRVPRILDEEQS